MRIQGKKRTAVSPVIATLLLIAIAVAAAIIVYAFVTGLIGGLSTGAGSSLVTITGGISVPTGSGAGTLVLSIKNGASNPIVGVALTSLTSGGLNYVPTPAVGFTFNGAAVTALNTLPVGSTAAAAISYNPGTAGSSPCGTAGTCAGGFTSGTTYTALFTITFANGSTQTHTDDITAQL